MNTATKFTARDLNRQPAKVLEAARRFGSAEIRTRSGEVFTLAPKPEKKSVGQKKEFPDFAARWRRMRQMGLVVPPPSENERINRIIAGEE